jgi:flagellar biosynthesis protein FlhG
MDKETGRSMRIITITNPKGGVGKTSVALNLSIALSKQGEKVCLVDGDFTVSSLMLNIGRDYRLDKSLLDKKDIFMSEAPKRGPEGIKIIPAPDLVKNDMAPEEYYERLLDILKDDDSFTSVVFDTAPGWSPAPFIPRVVKAIRLYWLLRRIRQASALPTVF